MLSDRWPFLKEVTIAVEGREDWMNSVISRKDASMRLVKCKPYGKSGMLQYVEISTKNGIEKAISSIKANPNVLESEFMKSDRLRASGFVITKDSPICRAISEYKGFCRSCVFCGDKSNNEWRIVLAGNDSLDEMLTCIEEKGVSIRNVETKSVPTHDILTFEQHNVIKIAEEQGFFEFPRRISLTRLATYLHMSKSNLEEILRRAEHKVTANYVSGFAEP